MLLARGYFDAKGNPVTAKTVGEILQKHASLSADFFTDDSPIYTKVGRPFPRHESVKHSRGEYARNDAHTNTVEGFFSILKRGLNGIYHNVSEKHLHRYLSEFDFRYNNRMLSDGQRAVAAIKSAQGKRLTYLEQIGRE